MPPLATQASNCQAGAMLIGHEEQQRQFLSALAAGQMHHAWLLAGPMGVGKRQFAEAATLRLLAGEGQGMQVPADHAAVPLMLAGSHPDHRLLEPETDDKGKRSGVINVHQVRRLQTLFRGTPALAAWRTVIVDSIDEMNSEATNAFLKSLEEPPPQTAFFLVSHMPGRLLPTIRSRCRLLRFAPLAVDQVEDVLKTRGIDAGQASGLASLSGGSAGRAMMMADPALAGLHDEVRSVWEGREPLEFARSFQPAGAQARFAALMWVVPDLLAKAARRTKDIELARLHSEAIHIARDATRLAYDRVQVALALAEILARAGHLERSDQRS